MDNSSLFKIDTSPAYRNEMDIPKYQLGRKSTELLNLEEKFMPMRSRPQLNGGGGGGGGGACWNCGSTKHSIRDCHHEPNRYTQEWNKEVQNLSKNYNSKRNMKTASRYHETEESRNYSCKRPASPSPRLRKILGIGEDELPSYVYRLRHHGYPKAWLKFATVNPSGINLYDAFGNEVADPNAEEGEIFEEEDKVKYDLSKLIRLPGFNMPLPENSTDEYKKHDSTPYDSNQSVEIMIKKLQEKAVGEYVLRKNKGKKNIISEDTKDTEMDMELDSFSETNVSVAVEVTESFVAPLPEDRVVLPPLPGEIKTIDVLEVTSTETPHSPSVPDKGVAGRVISSEEGTPLLRSKFGHNKLPPPENFSKDICDVINFENLPESTGKFERMRGLLKKVKRILGIQNQKTS